jgi:hypothetical protein
MPGFKRAFLHTTEMFGIIKQEIIILFRIISALQKEKGE